MKYLVVFIAACLAVVPAEPLRNGKDTNPLHEAALGGPVADVTKAIVDAILDRIWKRTYGVEYDGVQLSEVQDEKIPVHVLEEAVVGVTKIYVNAILHPIWESEYLIQHNDVPNAGEEFPVYILEGILGDVTKKVVGEILDRILGRKYYGEEKDVQNAPSPYKDEIPLNKLEGIVDDIAEEIVGTIFDDFFEAESFGGKYYEPDYNQIDGKQIAGRAKRNIFDVLVIVADLIINHMH